MVQGSLNPRSHSPPFSLCPPSWLSTLFLYLPTLHSFLASPQGIQASGTTILYYSYEGLSALDSVVIRMCISNIYWFQPLHLGFYPCPSLYSKSVQKFCIPAGTAAIAELDDFGISTRAISQHSHLGCCEAHPGFYLKGPGQASSALLTLSHVNRPGQNRLLQSLRM